MSQRFSAALVAALVAGVLVGLVAWQLRHGGSGLPTPPVRSSGLAIPSPVEDYVVFGATAQQPAMMPDMLPAGLPQVFAFYHLPLTGTPRTVRWRRLGQGFAPVPAGDMTPDARPGQGRALLRPTQGSLQPGVYEVEFEGESRRFVTTFIVVPQAEAIAGQAAPAEAELRLLSTVAADGVKPTGEPLRPQSEFAGGERIYIVFRYEGAEPGTALTIEWFGGSEQITEATREITLPAESGWGNGWLQATLPPGEYHASLRVSGDQAVLATVPFRIR